jgi:hypothetical protein
LPTGIDFAFHRNKFHAEALPGTHGGEGAAFWPGW